MNGIVNVNGIPNSILDSKADKKTMIEELAKKSNISHTHNYAGSSSAGGSATSAVKLQTSRTVRTNLASTSTASFDGSANIMPGVTGTLSVANGGTGATTAENARTNLGAFSSSGGTISGNVVINGSVAEGESTKAEGSNSHAEGKFSVANGDNSHAEGIGTLALNYGSHAEGIQTVAGKAPILKISSTTASSKTFVFDTTFHEYEEAFAKLSANMKIYITNKYFYARDDMKVFTIASINNTNHCCTVKESIPSSDFTAGYAVIATHASLIFQAHAEGQATLAIGDDSHAEGNGTVAIGSNSHAEGSGTTASGNNSHAEGSGSIAIGRASHAEGSGSIASGDVSHAETGGTASGGSSHAEGNGTKAIGLYTHTEGYNTTASGTAAHAEGNHTTAKGNHSHVEGYNTTASSSDSHAEGNYTTASGDCSHAEGYSTTASGSSSHAEGSNTIASGSSSHAEGSNTVASGGSSHAGGGNTIASAVFQTVIGTYNKESTTSVDTFIIGNGNDAVRSNCFRVSTLNGVYANGSYHSNGADYAEYFKWADDNRNNEDRIGLFVTLDGEEIRIAQSCDDYILGIISGTASVVGDVYDDQWKGMYLIDLFGRPILEQVEIPEKVEEITTIDENGKEIKKMLVVEQARTEIRQKINPDFDNSQKYIPRSERPEWATVGMMGKLVAIDDGTCEKNGWCTVGNGGIATKSEQQTRFRVMARIDESHIKVLML